jgi:mRNA-degrading endonuclease RelE of RelBE toxin-antitoxin system
VVLYVRPEAQKELAVVPRLDREKLVARLEQIALDPFGNHPAAKRLQGTPGFSVRQGVWRAICRISGVGDVIVIRIRHRRKVYRWGM